MTFIQAQPGQQWLLRHFSFSVTYSSLSLWSQSWHLDLQEDVREFASGVVHDALKIAVSFHGGAYNPTAVCIM